MNEDPYVRLANAIIIQAAKDYRRAKRQLKKNPEYKPAKKMLNETERFFHSDLYQTLTKVDADYLIDKLARA